MTLRDPRAVVICLSLLILTTVCAPPPFRSTLHRPLSRAELAELWIARDDAAELDLFHGPGGRELAPDPKAEYLFLEKDTTGFSDGYDVVGPRGLEWSLKLGPEAQTEVVASRLIWAAGFHQPPTYYLPEWRLVGGPEAGVKGPARFRPKVAWLDRVGEWSWHQNPFVGTQPFRGLIVLNLMLNNADLREPNNIVYELPVAREHARRWFVVRDVGGSLGATGYIYGTRNDIDGFERQGFLLNSDGDGESPLSFDYHGRHRELLTILRSADVRWAAERWAALTPEQWRAAFAAAQYDEATAQRYIRKLEEKIAQGLELGS